MKPTFGTKESTEVQKYTVADGARLEPVQRGKESDADAALFLSLDSNYGKGESFSSRRIRSLPAFSDDDDQPQEANSKLQETEEKKKDVDFDLLSDKYL